MTDATVVPPETTGAAAPARPGFAWGYVFIASCLLYAVPGIASLFPEATRPSHWEMAAPYLPMPAALVSAAGLILRRRWGLTATYACLGLFVFSDLFQAAHVTLFWNGMHDTVSAYLTSVGTPEETAAFMQFYRLLSLVRAALGIATAVFFFRYFSRRTSLFR